MLSVSQRESPSLHIAKYHQGLNAHSQTLMLFYHDLLTSNSCFTLQNEVPLAPCCIGIGWIRMAAPAGRGGGTRPQGDVRHHGRGWEQVCARSVHNADLIKVGKLICF